MQKCLLYWFEMCEYIKKLSWYHKTRFQWWKWQDIKKNSWRSLIMNMVQFQRFIGKPSLLYADSVWVWKVSIMYDLYGKCKISCSNQRKVKIPIPMPLNEAKKKKQSKLKQKSVFRDLISLYQLRKMRPIYLDVGWHG